MRYVRHALTSNGGAAVGVLLAFPALLVFPALALAIERLALFMVRQDEQVRALGGGGRGWHTAAL